MVLLLFDRSHRQDAFLLLRFFLYILTDACIHSFIHSVQTEENSALVIFLYLSLNLFYCENMYIDNT